jgi:hypothetical protein
MEKCAGIDGTRCQHVCFKHTHTSAYASELSFFLSSTLTPAGNDGFRAGALSLKWWSRCETRKYALNPIFLRHNHTALLKWQCLRVY